MNIKVSCHSSDAEAAVACVLAAATFITRRAPLSLCLCRYQKHRRIRAGPCLRNAVEVVITTVSLMVCIKNNSRENVIPVS